MTMPPGVLTRYGAHLRTPFERIHYAGTETATQWSGYINGAIQAGERAAREVLARQGRLSEQEVWQEEPESIEYPRPVWPKESWLERNAPSARQFKRYVHRVEGLTLVGCVLGLALWFGRASLQARN